MSVVGDPWLRDARNKKYITFRAARRKFDDAVEEARAGREKGGRNRKEEPPLDVFLWVALLGVLAKVMMRGRPISLKSMQQQQELQRASMPPAAAAAACQHATCSSNSSSRSSTGSSFMLLRSTCARDGCMRASVVCMRVLRVYVGACVSGCACIHVFAHNTIAWMYKFKSCVCMYVCTTHMRMACARACMRCACSQKRNCECQNV